MGAATGRKNAPPPPPPFTHSGWVGPSPRTHPRDISILTRSTPENGLHCWQGRGWPSASEQKGQSGCVAFLGAFAGPRVTAGAGYLDGAGVIPPATRPPGGREADGVAGRGTERWTTRWSKSNQNCPGHPFPAGRPLNDPRSRNPQSRPYPAGQRPIDGGWRPTGDPGSTCYNRQPSPGTKSIANVVFWIRFRVLEGGVAV